MPQFRHVIPLSLAVISALLMILIGCIGLLPPAAPIALAGPADALKLSIGYDQIAQPGDTISFTHILTNAGSVTDSLLIAATSPVTWPIELGISGQPIGTPPFSITLSAGLSTTFYVSLTVPENTAIVSGTVAPIVITAASQLSPTAVVSTTDHLTVYTGMPNISYTLYVPSIAYNGGARFVQLGVDFGPSVLLSDTTDLTVDVALARDLGTTWTRAWLPWAQIETAPGHYDWSWADTQFNRFAQAGYKIDAVVYFPPPWAAGTECGPISNTAALTQFITAAIARYGNRVDAWEFINEPDSFGGYPSYGPAIGCWAPQPQLYADRLALFHDQVKALDPTALVVFGGLAYDNWPVFDRDFLTRTLQNGAGPYFDVLSLHFYPINAQDFPTIAHKITEIKTILQRLGVYPKLIWITETAMWMNGPGGFDAQQNYIVQEHTRGFCAGAEKIFWFSVREDIQPPPDRPMMSLKRWLINKDHQLEPGYTTYQNYAQQIEGAFCRGAYAQVPANVEAYELSGPTGEVYILWTITGTAEVAVPAGSSAVLIDRDGQTSLPLTATGGSVSFTVGPQPIFVVVKQ